MPSKAKPLTSAQLRAYESKRDLAAELLESVRQMKAGKTQVVSSPAVEARERTGLSQDTVARSLQRLRKANAFTVEPERHDDSGRFVSVRYRVDLTTLPIELLTIDHAVVREPGRSTRRTGASAEQLSMLG